jgi:hypothetical protein
MSVKPGSRPFFYHKCAIYGGCRKIWEKTVMVCLSLHIRENVTVHLPFMPPSTGLSSIFNDYMWWNQGSRRTRKYKNTEVKYVNCAMLHSKYLSCRHKKTELRQLVIRQRQRSKRKNQIKILAIVSSQKIVY